MPTLLAVAALLIAAPPASAPRLDGKAAFEAMKRLEGSWKAEGKETSYLTLRVIASGTAVLETITGTDRTKIVMTSIYSLDGAELVMSHYGIDGNQPHLKLKSMEGGKELHFETTGVTNLANPAASHVAAVALVVKDSDHLTQEWENLTAGKSTKIVFAFQREYLDTLK